MDKIETGEYVRTADGIIDKVIIEYTGKCNNSNCNCKHISCKNNYYDEEDIVKHSKDIIDLIEVGDIVNGRKIKEVRNIDGKIYLMTNYIVQDYIKTDIKSILTRQQHDQNCYVVEETR